MPLAIGDRRLLGLRAGLLVACLGIGVLAGRNPGYAVAAALGLAVVVAALAEITFGVVLFTFLSFFEVVVSSGGTASLMKVLGLLIFASWAAHELTATKRHPWRPSAPPLLLWAGVALVAWSSLSIIWAQDPGVAVQSSYRFLLNLLLIPIVLSVVRRRKQLYLIAGAFLTGAAMSAIYGAAAHITTSGATGRLTGTIGDPNDQAAVLVAAVPIGLALVGLYRNQSMKRLLCILGTAVCLVGIVLTLSRGGLVALGVVMLAGIFYGGRWRHVAAVGLVLAGFAAGTYFLALSPSSGAGSRVTSGSSTGRTDLWRIAEKIIVANPFLGVGSGDFQYAAVHYVNSVGPITSAYIIVFQPHVAHDVYLEMAADLGIPGLVIFVTLILGSLGAAARATRRAQERGDRDLELMSRCLVLSLVGFMAADVFLSGQLSKQLFLVMAMCPAAYVLAGTKVAISTPVEDS